MRANDTGESSAAITARADDVAWYTMLPMLKAGMPIVRFPRVRRSYARDEINGRTVGGVSDTRIRKLERDGVIRHTGVDRYELVEG